MPNEPPTVEALLVPDLVAARLAGVSRATWHRLRAAGKIGPQAVRLGKAVRYRRDEVAVWIDKGCPDAATWLAMKETENRRAAQRNGRPV
jgi:predicted DNA-binding transcriptional regulator AlpA